MLASRLLQKRFLLVPVCLPFLLRPAGGILGLFAFVLVMGGKLANADGTGTDCLSS